MKITYYLLIFLSLLTATAQAQNATIDANTKAILDKAHAAMKYDKLKTAKSFEQNGVMSIQAMNISGSVSIKTMEDKMRIETQVAGISEVTVINGKNSWSENISTGMRTLSPEEILSMQADTLKYMVNPELFYDSIKYIGEEVFNNKKCHKIEYMKKGLDPSYEFYDSTTMQLAGEMMTVPSPMGKMKTTMIVTTLKAHPDGFFHPEKMTQIIGPMTITMTLKDIKVNPSFNATLFEKPSE
jgi:outer membrane lipoprotein-sorting protein